MYLLDSTQPDARKEQKRNQLRRAEAQYLRFLRTKEKSANFLTIKVIGKGAFGEVRLVQHKSDGKIYALKSLVKSEMVSTNLDDPVGHYFSSVARWYAPY